MENPPPKASFLSSLTRQLFHGIHKIHLSGVAPGGNRGRKGGKERERERESVKGTVVPKCNNIKK